MHLPRKTWLLAGVLLLVSSSHASDAPPFGFCLPGKVLSVHDGDTATVEVRLKVQVRYLNCWAPELKDAGGPESRDSAKLAEGKLARLFVPLNDAGDIAKLFTFGRVVGELWLDGATESESQRQVNTGHASTKKGLPLGK